MRKSLDSLLARRLELEKHRSDFEQLTSLKTIRDELTRTVDSSSKKVNWEKVDSFAIDQLCKKVETILKEWCWKGDGRVEFVQDSKFDIKIDGKHRHSHGKGYRAILRTAFAIALMETCVENKTPHPGFLLIDSPVTTFKEGLEENSDLIDPVIETAFWDYLSATAQNQQIIVVENKEPSDQIKSKVKYTYFSGVHEQNQRQGFIPV